MLAWATPDLQALWLTQNEDAGRDLLTHLLGTCVTPRWSVSAEVCCEGGSAGPGGSLTAGYRPEDVVCVLVPSPRR